MPDSEAVYLTSLRCILDDARMARVVAVRPGGYLV